MSTRWTLCAELSPLFERDRQGVRSRLAAYADRTPVPVGNLVGRVFRVAELVDGCLVLAEVEAAQSGTEAREEIAR